MPYKVTRSADFLSHHGIKGQKWGVRRFQNEDGTLTPAGKERYKVERKDSEFSVKETETEFGREVTVENKGDGSSRIGKLMDDLGSGKRDFDSLTDEEQHEWSDLVMNKFDDIALEAATRLKEHGPKSADDYVKSQLGNMTYKLEFNYNNGPSSEDGLGPWLNFTVQSETIGYETAGDYDSGYFDDQRFYDLKTGKFRPDMY